MIFMSFLFACKEPYAPLPTLMIKSKQIKLSSQQFGANELVNTLSYSPKYKNFFFSVNPRDFKRKSFFSFSFKKSDSKNLKNYVESLSINGEFLGPIRRIESSKDGAYLAIIDWNGRLYIYKDGLKYFDSSFEFDIWSLEFGENLLALGDETGQVHFIDFASKKLLKMKKVIDGKVFSIAWVGNSMFVVAGTGNHFYLVNGLNGETERSIKTSKNLEDFIIFSGINHCYKNQINKVLHVPSHNLLFTSHGGDYCSRKKIKIWNLDTWELVHVIDDIKSTVSQMILVPKNNEVVFVDFDENLWRFDLEKFNLSYPFYLPDSFYLFNNLENFSKKVVSRFQFGTIISIINIPETEILAMAFGSYFKGGTGLLLSKLNKDSISHLIYSNYFAGSLNFYVSKGKASSIR